MRLTKHSLILLLPLCVLLFAQPAFTTSKINITVKTISATQDSQYVDPLLKGLAEELTSVFRYTDYRLLGEDRIQLQLKKTGNISLPGNRILKITPTRISGNRAELHLVILKENRQIFQTTIQLLNRGSITLGGPKHKKGILLLNIFNSF